MRVWKLSFRMLVRVVALGSGLIFLESCVFPVGWLAEEPFVKYDSVSPEQAQPDWWWNSALMWS